MFGRLLSTLHQKWLPHTRLPSVFMSKTSTKLDDKPLEFVGAKYRIGGAPGFTDDRLRNEDGIVSYAPNKIMPDLVGGGIEVSEDYPMNEALILNPASTEATVPRLARGEKIDTLTSFHHADIRTFDIAVANFKDTLDAKPPLLKELKEKLKMRAVLGFEELEGEEDFGKEDFEKPAWDGAANPTTKQPDTPFNARYPYNHVRETESGHLFESDDTPGSERIKESHRSGTYYEIFPDGTKVEKIVRERFTVIVSNDKVNIQGNSIVTIEGDCNLYTKGNYTHQVDGDYNLLVKGKHTVQVADDTTLDCHANYFHNVGFSIDKAKAALDPAEGRGNKGGSVWIRITGDRQMTVNGNGIDTFGEPKLFEMGVSDTHKQYRRMVFGSSILTDNADTQVMTSRDFTEVIGRHRKCMAVGQTIFRSTGEIEIAGAKIQLNPTEEGIDGTPVPPPA